MTYIDTYMGRSPCNNRSKDSSDVATNQRTPKTARKHQKLGENHGIDSPSETSDPCQPWQPLDFGFLAS